MASSLPTTASASASASLVTKPGVGPANLPGHCNSLLSFRLSPTPNLRFLAKGMQPSHSFSTLVRAQLNETKSEGPSAELKDPRPSSEPAALATEESISEFITQVASLVKLVDSRDIVELQLKQFDCELLIRKKEALPQPPSPPAPAIMMQSPPPPPLMPVAAPAPPQTVASTPPSSPAPPASPPVASAKSSLPPLKCPMAGTFYRSAAPGEPPFVKVGDKVQKGQVLCIIEAMKLMNEIEADQSGTIVEILVEDGKTVSIDMLPAVTSFNGPSTASVRDSTLEAE